VVQDLTMWKGMHRFLPALARMKGATIRQIPVRHRARAGGTSKYTNLSRLRQTLWDLWAVRWMQKRNPRFTVRMDRVE
jgi:dolichol-phosphate mannosyltransferase